MKITTDNKYRPLISGYELTNKEKLEFDYHVGDGMFFRYRGHVYSIGEFIRDSGPNNWDASSADTAFSGTLIKLSKCGEYVKVGYMTC